MSIHDCLLSYKFRLTLWLYSYNDVASVAVIFILFCVVAAQLANRVCEEQKSLRLAWLCVCRRHVLCVHLWCDLYASSLQHFIYNWSACENSSHFCHIQKGTAALWNINTYNWLWYYEAAVVILGYFVLATICETYKFVLFCFCHAVKIQYDGRV